jgi:hypothetical protein
MKYLPLVIWIGLGLGCLQPLRAQTQPPAEVLGPSWEGRAISAPPQASASRSGKDKDTLFLRSGQPFFDDFSSGTIPDSTFWDLCASDPARYPQVTRHAAVNPPS